MLGQALRSKNIMYREAVAELQKAVEVSRGSPALHSQSCLRLRRIRDASEAAKLLNDLKNRSNLSLSHAPEIAMVYVALGEKDQAMTWLEKRL